MLINNSQRIWFCNDLLIIRMISPRDLCNTHNICWNLGPKYTTFISEFIRTMTYWVEKEMISFTYLIIRSWNISQSVSRIEIKMASFGGPNTARPEVNFLWHNTFCDWLECFWIYNTRRDWRSPLCGDGDQLVIEFRISRTVSDKKICQRANWGRLMESV